jgi:tetratricopeptide (TPR) repeat protein
MQGSYKRRNPTKAAVPYLEAARHGLREFVQQDSRSSEAWRLLAQAEECLLNYREAIDCLERAMHLENRRDRKDLKKLALLKEYLADWEDLPLTPQQLQDLGGFLVQAGVEDERKGRSLQFTQQWLSRNGIPKPETVIEALRRRGGFTDFMVLYNVVR